MFRWTNEWKTENSTNGGQRLVQSHSKKSIGSNLI